MASMATSAASRDESPNSRRMGAAMIIPTPKPMTDSRNGATPSATSSTRRGRSGASDATPWPNTWCRPVNRSTANRAMPPYKMRSTSTARGMALASAAPRAAGDGLKAGSTANPVTSPPKAAHAGATRRSSRKPAATGGRHARSTRNPSAVNGLIFS